MLLLFSILATHTVANAEQWLLADPLTWDARFMFDGNWRNTETSPGNTQSSDELRYREQLSFKKRIHILDPGIATFSFDVSPIFSQTDYNNTDGTGSESDSATWNYAVNSSFLHGTKIPLSLMAGMDKASGTTDGSLGTRTDFDNKNERLALNLRNIYFPFNISYTEREQDMVQDPGSGITPIHTNEKTRRWNYRGHNSKMNLDVERLQYDDIIRNRHYSYDREQLSHTFNWGKNSYIRSQLEHREQKDFGAYENTMVTENIRLQHTQQLFSTYRYSYSNTERTVNTTTHSSDMNINHQLFNNLTTQVGYQQKVSQFSNGTSGKSTTKGPLYSLSYNKKLPMKKSHISMGFNGSRLETEQEGGTQLVDVINYSQTFSTDLIILNQQYIDITTIEVINANTSAVYTLGNDYTISQAPSGYTEINRIDIAGGGTININEDVLINFSHWAPGNISQHKGYFFRLNINNFQLYHNQSQNNQELNLDPNSLVNVTFPSGFSQTTNTRESTSGISYNVTKEKYKIGLGAENQNTKLDFYETRSRTLRQNITYSFNPLTLLTASASQSNIETSLSKTSSATAKASLNIRIPQSRVTVKPHLSYRQQDNTLGNDDRYLNEGVDFEWRYYLITFNSSLNFYQWDGTSRNSDDTRLMFNLIRRSK